MRIIGDIVLAGFGQIKNARVDNISTDPASPSVGQVWYNTADGVYRGYNGTEVITFATGGNTQLILDALAAETAARQAADTQLATDLAAETSARTAADTAEATARADADAQLATDLAAEATARADAITSEATARAAADAQLRTDFEAADAAAASNLATEVAARQAGDTALDVRLTAVEGSYINKDGSVAFTGDQSMGSHKLTAVANPVDGGDAANKAYVDSRISNLGAAFEYVGGVVGGASTGAAFDVTELSDTTAGSYYKVTGAGFLKYGEEGAAVYVNATDGIVFNTTAGFDVIDNSNSQVLGTTNFVEVTGNSDAGFTVDLDETFKGRIDTLETGLSDEAAARAAADTQLAGDLATEVAARFAADATLESSIAAEASARAAADAQLTSDLAAETAARQAADATLADNLTTVGNVAETLAVSVVGVTATGNYVDGSPFGHENFNSAATIIEALLALNAALLSSKQLVRDGHFVYTAGLPNTTHVVTHNLGQKYCQVIVVDSNDKVVIPDSITFTNESELVVEFISAMTCKIVVTAPVVEAVV